MTEPFTLLVLLFGSTWLALLLVLFCPLLVLLLKITLVTLVRLVSAVLLDGMHPLTTGATLPFPTVAVLVQLLTVLSAAARPELAEVTAVVLTRLLLPRLLIAIFPWMIPLTVLPRLMVAPLLMGLRLMLQPVLMIPVGIMEMLAACEIGPVLAG